MNEGKLMLDNQQRQRHDVPDGQPYDDATNVRATALLGITNITARPAACQTNRRPVIRSRPDCGRQKGRYVRLRADLGGGSDAGGWVCVL
jgi:hypothetical protein